MIKVSNILIEFTKHTNEFDSVLVVLSYKDKLVLVKNKNRAWEFPGGHRENDESYKDTAKREAYEEAGVTLKEIAYIGYYILPNNHKTIITYSQVKKFFELPVKFETERVNLFDSLPTDLSYKDGLYEAILKEINI